MFIFILCLFVLSQASSEEPLNNKIVIIDFKNNTAYDGKWLLEKELPKALSITLQSDKYNIEYMGYVPEVRKILKKQNEKQISSLLDKYNATILITGDICDFSNTTSITTLGPVRQRIDTAKVEIMLYIATKENVYEETCTAEEQTKKTKFDPYIFIGISMEEEKIEDATPEPDFGTAEFYNTLPGKATRKALTQCKEVLIGKYISKICQSNN